MLDFFKRLVEKRYTETEVLSILSGQYVLLILKLGYFTNTTYGYIKWSKYIREHQKTNEKLSLF